jgi:hypothetical protein
MRPIAAETMEFEGWVWSGALIQGRRKCSLSFGKKKRRCGLFNSATPFQLCNRQSGLIGAIVSL